jgi:hypothetical protein
MANNDIPKTPTFIVGAIPNEVRLHEARRIVLPHLKLDLQYVPENTTRFLEALAAYVEHPEEDVTGLGLYNLRDMAKSLEMHYRRIGGELTQLDIFPTNDDQEAK